jgi:hypothetical protein
MQIFSHLRVGPKMPFPAPSYGEEYNLGVNVGIDWVISEMKEFLETGKCECLQVVNFAEMIILKNTDQDSSV